MAPIDESFLEKRAAQIQAKGDSRGGSNHNGGSGSGGGEVENRIEALEKAIPDIREKLVRVETKVESIDKHCATKADLVTTESTLIKWFVGTAFAMVGLTAAITFGLARFLA